MEKLTDEKIQQLLDSNMIIAPSADVELYQKVYSELAKLPDVHVTHLAQNVVTAVQNKIDRKAAIKTYLVIAASLIVALSVFVVASLHVDKLLTLKILSVLNHFKWIVVFLIAVKVVSSASERLISISQLK